MKEHKRKSSGNSQQNVTPVWHMTYACQAGRAFPAYSYEGENYRHVRRHSGRATMPTKMVNLLQQRVAGAGGPWRASATYYLPPLPTLLFTPATYELGVA